jgi:hypothetical protein
MLLELSIMLLESSIMLLESSIMLLESSFILLQNIYSTVFTHDDPNMLTAQATDTDNVIPKLYSSGKSTLEIKCGIHNINITA